MVQETTRATLVATYAAAFASALISVLAMAMLRGLQLPVIFDAWNICTLKVFSIVMIWCPEDFAENGFVIEQGIQETE
jgi:hypothetical protein